MKRLTDPDFKYVPAARTDLRKTFARVRRELRSEAERQKATPPVVVPLSTKSK